MILRLTLTFLVALLCQFQLMAQSADSVSNPEVYYSVPKTYILGGVSVTGIGEHYDAETLIQLAGLTIGQELKIPGDDVTKAIKKLYGHGLFSDITISVDKIVDGKVYLVMNLTERHKLAKIEYIGFKKSEETKVKERINPLPGTQVTDNMVEF